MSNFPEIIDALNIISDEAITKDDSGKYVKLKLIEIYLQENRNIFLKLLII